MLHSQNVMQVIKRIIVSASMLEKRKKNLEIHKYTHSLTNPFSDVFFFFFFFYSKQLKKLKEVNNGKQTSK